MSVQPWKKVGSKPAGDYRIFTIRSDLAVSPRTQKEHEFYVIDCVDWVNVVAVTRDQQLVMIEQYRHGSNTVELEIPGGMMDPEDDTPIKAAVRELREETGYEGSEPVVIGQVFPNPAIMSNRCYTVLVRDCECRHSLKLDEGEDLSTRLLPVTDIPDLLAKGKIGHSLVVVALTYYDLWTRRQF